MLVEAHSIAVASGTSVQAEKSVLPGIKGIDAGNAHTIMLLETGEIFSWGDNFYGQLGLGYASRDNTPNSFYLTRNYLEPQMIDRPTRIKKFDHVQSTIGANNSQIIFTTVTGCVRDGITPRKSAMCTIDTDFVCTQDGTGGQRHLRAGTNDCSELIY